MRWITPISTCASAESVITFQKCCRNIVETVLHSTYRNNFCRQHLCRKNYVCLPIDLSICLSIYISICLSVYLSIYGSTAFVYLGRFFSFLILYTVGRTPCTEDQPVASPLPTHRTTQAQNKPTQTSMTPSSGVRTHDPSVRAGEDCPCLRTRGLPLWSAWKITYTDTNLALIRRRWTFVVVHSLHVTRTSHLLPETS
jgi:hypothetical protein